MGCGLYSTSTKLTIQCQVFRNRSLNSGTWL